MFKPKVQQPVFIVGMHRSGTSMVSAALNDAGVYMGAIRDHNAEAFYGVDLNDRMLEKAGGSWWNPPPREALEEAMMNFQEALTPTQMYTTHLKSPSGRALSLARQWIGPWGLKDPRLCLTLDWWLKKFPKAKVIWILRDEDDVVASMLRRQEKEDEAASRLDARSALQLVRTYNEAAALAIRESGVEHRSVRYEELTSEDVNVQRRAWFSLYSLCKVRPGKMEGFTRKSAPVKVETSEEQAKELPTSGPLVSVLVPNYNHAPYLDARISSILDQTYTSIEVLLMDDCSPDDSREVLTKWAAQDDRVQLLFNETNSGSPFAQWAKGAEWAKGKYLWIAESDDFCDLDMLALHVDALERNAHAVLAYSHSHLVDEQGQFLRDFLDDYGFIFGDHSRWKQDFTGHGPTEVATTMVYSNTIPNASGVLFRKSAFDQTGAPQTTWKLNGDWYFYANLLQHGDFVFHAQPRNKFRLHQRTQRKRAAASYTAFDEILKMYDGFQAAGWVPLETLDRARGQVAMWWAANVYHMDRTAEVMRNNRRMYRTFRPYRKGLLVYLLKNIAIKLTGQFFIKLGLKAPVKKLAVRLFPKTFFAH
jgi:glycosyltransferase involved in cell wall biosynthesis